MTSVFVWRKFARCQVKLASLAVYLLRGRKVDRFMVPGISEDSSTIFIDAKKKTAGYAAKLMM